LTSPIAGSVLPLQRAEDLILTLPGVISARIVPDGSGAVAEIHVLTSSEAPPKQTVRNIESALLAHLGMRVDHRKVSVATTTETRASREPARAEGRAGAGKRELYFEDVEVRGSRTKGTLCRVTLRRGNQSFVGESEGVESDRSRLELAGRATLNAIVLAYNGSRKLGLEGIKVIAVFDRTIVLAAVAVQVGRETMLLTGTCEVRESAETAGVLAVLDAINRWIELER
jgi:hypothetical protein